ncbi:hypothetical protein V8B97DRAFT_954578, partial [Scleroderma yunnanense]
MHLCRLRLCSAHSSYPTYTTIRKIPLSFVLTLRKKYGLSKIFPQSPSSRLYPYTMNNPKVDISANETVSTSDAGETELCDALLFRSLPATTVKCPLHVLRLHVPTSIENITLSFELKSKGPVTIEISFTADLLELTTCAQKSVINNTTRVSAIKSEHMEASNLSHLLTGIQASSVHILDPVLPTDDKPANLDTAITTVPPGASHAPFSLTDGSITEPKSGQETPTAVQKTALKPPVYPLPTWVPGPSFKCSFTPDSFTRLETFCYGGNL